MSIRSSVGCLGAIALLSAGSALAENTYQWQNTADRSANFSEAANWDGTSPVNNASGQLDDVFRFDGDLPFYQTAYQGTVKYGAFYYYGSARFSGRPPICSPVARTACTHAG